MLEQGQVGKRHVRSWACSLGGVSCDAGRQPLDRRAGPIYGGSPELRLGDPTAPHSSKHRGAGSVAWVLPDVPGRGASDLLAPASECPASRQHRVSASKAFLAAEDLLQRLLGIVS